MLIYLTMRWNVVWYKFWYSFQVLAKRHVDLFTAQAWLLKSEELEEKVCLLCIFVHIIEFLFAAPSFTTKYQTALR